MQPTLSKLPNGVLTLHQEVSHTKLIHCGIVINAGSKNETPEINGVAHFIEHMMFKGTKTKKTNYILNRIDSVGGELDAYTTKEKICIYASAASEYFERIAELVSDMVFNSTFPEKEIEKEKQVVVEEIEMYRDNPEDSILDEFEEIIFGASSFGKPILGTNETVVSLEVEKIKKFISENFTKNKILFFASGNVNSENFTLIADKYLSQIKLPETYEKEVLFEGYNKKEVVKIKNLQQANIVIGGLTCSRRAEHFVPFTLLNYYLGGPSMNSLLNLSIREKYGLTYYLYSFANHYLETGVWGVYAGCEYANIKKVRKLIEKELVSLSENKLSDLQVEKIKKQFIGNMLLGSENYLSQALGNAKDALDFERIFSIEEGIEMVNAVTNEQLLDTAQLYLSPQLLSSILYKPEGK